MEILALASWEKLLDGSHANADMHRGVHSDMPHVMRVDVCCVLAEING